MDTKINKLEEIDRTKNPFKVPDNYFAQFNEEIMNRLPEKEIVIPEPVSLWDKAKPWIYLAALFTGLYFTVNFLKQPVEGEKMAANKMITQQTLSGSITNTDYDWSTVQISEEEFFQYLEEQIIDDNLFDYMYYQYNSN